MVYVFSTSEAFPWSLERALMGRLAVVLFLVSAVFVAIFVNKYMLVETVVPTIRSEYFGPGKEQKDNEKIEPFKVSVSNDTLEDLKLRLKNTRFFASLEEARFNYGFNTEYLREVQTYWRDQYDWAKQQERLNEVPHFRTQIEGLHVHFLHVKPPSGKYAHVYPLLIVHGWPGSVWEFYKIIPMLTDPQKFGIGKQLAFEVIAPSIPGYAWSDAPRKQGFGPIAAARVFAKLMKRLKMERYFCQGGDWGSIITNHIAQMYPDNVIGWHTNMPFVSPFDFPGILLKQIVGLFAPGLVLSPADYSKVYPMGQHFLDLLQETGYFHIQTTKPDTVGFALNDSPLGLAAYILEKFSTWTHKAYRDMPDGGLKRHFTMDDLLTNVMIYWVTGTIGSSQRFYKEWIRHPDRGTFDKVYVKVPTGVASFPQELARSPRTFLEHKYLNITTYTDMQRGGHFGAFEEPKLLAEDVFRFASSVLGSVVG